MNPRNTQSHINSIISLTFIHKILDFLIANFLLKFPPFIFHRQWQTQSARQAREDAALAVVVAVAIVAVAVVLPAVPHAAVAVATRRRNGSPVTKVGRLVKDGKIKTLEELFLFSLPIKEFQVIDYFLPNLKEEVCFI